METININNRDHRKLFLALMNEFEEYPDLMTTDDLGDWCGYNKDSGNMYFILQVPSHLSGMSLCMTAHFENNKVVVGYVLTNDEGEEEEFNDYDEMMEEEEEGGCKYCKETLDYDGEHFCNNNECCNYCNRTEKCICDDHIDAYEASANKEAENTQKREYDEDGKRVVRLKCCGVKFRKEECICPQPPPKSDENACCMCKKTYKKDDEEDDYCYCDDCDELSVRQNIIDDENKRMPLLDKLIWLGEKMKDPFFTD